MSALEPTRPLAGDLASTVPALIAGVSMVSATTTAAIWVMDGFGRDAGDAVFSIAVLSWIAGALIAVVALVIAALRAALARAQGRTAGLPSTAAGIALLVLAVAVVLPVGVGVGAWLRPPAPTTLGAYSVPLTAPWVSMHLPVAGGSVLYADNSTATIVYQNGVPAAQAAIPYDRQIRAMGWRSTFANASGGMFVGTYVKGPRTMTLATMDTQGMTTISLTTI